jgi:hypothetical protein
MAEFKKIIAKSFRRIIEFKKTINKSLNYIGEVEKTIARIIGAFSDENTNRDQSTYRASQ